MIWGKNSIFLKRRFSHLLFPRSSLACCSNLYLKQESNTNSILSEIFDVLVSFSETFRNVNNLMHLK